LAVSGNERNLEDLANGNAILKIDECDGHVRTGTEGLGLAVPEMLNRSGAIAKGEKHERVRHSPPAPF